jgi:UDP-2,3-diacylglucosamine pyrophosphatase LpxH
MSASPRYRAVFISDLHLGSSGCRARELASFLKRVRTDKLYLVGDVIDMWRLRQRWFWPEKHNRVVTRILKHARRGTKVIFIPGNHDEHARQYKGLNFGGVEILLEADHTTADGKRLLITHGDQFDLIVKHARLLSVLGSWAYDTLVVLNNQLNWMRTRLGLQHWSLSQFIKLRIKTACAYINQFEQVLSDEAHKRGFDGVVCGHIHKAEIRNIEGKSPILYINCGDWIEGCTAVVEHSDGRLELVDAVKWLEAHREARREKAARKRLVMHKVERIDHRVEPTEYQESVDA